MANNAPASILEVRRLDAVSEPQLQALADVLVDCVDGGASVSFMLPMTRAKALAFWRRVADGVARGERVLLVAEDADGIVGTVQVILDLPENQPHRADVAKMLVHRRARRRGLGEALMRAAEREAAREGKTLLVLDTADDTAARLYARVGWQRVGTIPRYALLPGGGECATTYFYRALAA
ncbi:MAG: GNAT family N-acetyltransferase [Burkholderiales bacterium]|nr:GNAT family N-acetyltransferase [Burkholderiales bacterium]